MPLSLELSIPMRNVSENCALLALMKQQKFNELLNFVQSVYIDLWSLNKRL